MVLGIEAVIAQHFKMFFRDVNNQTLNEVDGRNTFSNSFIIFVPSVMESHIFTIITINTRSGNNRASQISADIFNRNVGSA